MQQQLSLKKKQLQRNINISYRRGKQVTNANGIKSYKLDDSYSVFEKVTNTPKYWQTAKYEMLARLDNDGPFQFFFTLSCADTKWDENFSSILHSQGYKVSYEVTEDSMKTYVEYKNGDQIELKEFLRKNVEPSLHELVRQNVLTATRNYDYRIKKFIKEIVTSPGNPMNVIKYSSKVEFQGRGAPHNHGTLWVDLTKIEFTIDGENENDCSNISSYYSTDNTSQAEKICLQNAMRKSIQSLQPIIYNNEEEIAIRNFNRIYTNQDQNETLDDILKKIKPKFKMLGLKSAFYKLQINADLDEQEEIALIHFANKFTTCTLNPNLVGEDVTELVKEVNIHCHTRSCRKYNCVCRFLFPRFPIWKTVIGRPSHLANVDASTIQKYKEILKNVKEVLEDRDFLEDTMSKYDKKSEIGENYQALREERIKLVLKRAGLETEEDWEMYEKALKFSGTGYSVILQRDIDEIYVNNYNKEWIRAWRGNMDLQVCLDFFAVITYITEYYTKDDTATMKFLMDALKGSETATLKERMILVMNTFLTVRQIGEAEALYRILPELNLKFSNSVTVFVPTCKKEDRSKFLKAVEKEQISHAQVVVQVEDKDGFFIENYDVVDKWYRRTKDLDDLCFLQCARMFRPGWKVRKECDDEEEGNNDTEDEDECTESETDIITEDNKFNFIMSSNKNSKPRKLPNFFKLKTVNLGEPPFMIKRKFPAVARFHKYKESNNPHKFYFSELLLYHPHFDESEIFPNDEVACSSLYLEKIDEITAVKNQVMEHLQGVEEARYFVERSLAENPRIGDALDAAGEQDDEDCEYEGIMEHPDFLHFDIEDLQTSETTSRSERIFPVMELDEISTLHEKTRNLDPYQRRVVDIAVKFAKDLVKSLNKKVKLPKPPTLLVHGGAGCGKSTVINVLKQWVHLILQRPGDNPDLPYVLVTAPTGTAASNVKGQTLHTSFSFHFGNNYISLSDKNRDAKRNQFQNLKFLIIDEISMVKSDMLYQLDRRLREITQKMDEEFGGVSLLCFGDILQLKPCMGRYVFERPQCEDFHLKHEISPLWPQFDVIILEENHRQDGDHEYANVLNRIRVGEPTENDVEILKKRVKSKNHLNLEGAMVIDCKNLGVGKHNKKQLNKMSGELIEIEATNLHPLYKDFKPPISKKGTVKDTPFLQTLQLKVGAKIMVTLNIDTLDGITNGARGTVRAAIKDGSNKFSKLIIKFDDPSVGELSRQNNSGFAVKYPGCTVIEKVMFQYSLCKKSSLVSNCAKVVQFPVTLCFAATAHKVQGQTVIKPTILAVDLNTVFEPAQGYVMLSRVQCLNQLVIIDSLPVDKLYASQKALEEVKRMESISCNKNPSSWFSVDQNIFKIASLNCRSLRKHIQDIANDPTINKADVVCLSETWLTEEDDSQKYNIPGLEICLNSIGSGKGLAIFYKENKCHTNVLVKEQNLQMSKLSHPQFDVIAIYRSKKGSQETLIEAIRNNTSQTKTTIVMGDFNLCAIEDHQSVMSQGMLQLGYSQLVTTATHIGGTHYHILIY